MRSKLPSISIVGGPLERNKARCLQGDYFTSTLVAPLCHLNYLRLRLLVLILITVQEVLTHFM